MKWDKQFEKLRNIQASEAQQTRIYHNITRKHTANKPLHWQAVAAMLSIIVIFIALLFIGPNQSITTAVTDERVILHIKQQKTDFLFPVQMYTNVSSFTLDGVPRVIDDILNGQRQGNIVDKPTEEMLPISSSTSYVYVAERGDVILFEFQGDALYDVQRNIRYSLHEDEKLPFHVLNTSIKGYVGAAIVIFCIWLVIVQMYYKQTGQSEKDISSAPKHWRHAFYSILVLLFMLWFFVLFGDAVIFKGWFVLLFSALFIVLISTRRFLVENSTEHKLKTITIVLQFIVSVVFLLQL